MVRRDGAEVRRERIQEITKRALSLFQNHGEISLSKTLALLQYETGLTREKLGEYLAIAEATEHFIIDLERDKIRKMTYTPEDDAHE